jgi:hypothetical protein
MHKGAGCAESTALLDDKGPAGFRRPAHVAADALPGLTGQRDIHTSNLNIKILLRMK